METTFSRWLIYALGGGMGHLMRALALARAAARRGHSIRILSNSPFACELLSGQCRRLVDLDPRITISPLSSRADCEVTRHHVRQEILTGQYDVLVTDTFPRGLGGELADLLPKLDVPRILVHRDLNPRYVARFDLRSIADHYDRILIPGETAPLADAPHAVVTEPWLICDSGELLSADSARRTLGVEPHDPCRLAVVCGSGKPAELDDVAELSVQLQEHLGPGTAVRLAVLGRSLPSATAELRVRCWPLLAALGVVDLLIGAGGYNTVQETRATGTPLLAYARRRLYDRQHRRLRRNERVDNDVEVMDRAATILGTASPREFSPALRYPNGVHDAVRNIESLGVG